MDFDFVLGTGVSLFSLAVGYGLGKRAGLSRSPELVQAICPCKHGINFHEELTGHCHGMMETSTYSTSSGTKTKEIPCKCQHYAGPELVSSVTMQQIAFRQVTDDEGSS